MTEIILEHRRSRKRILITNFLSVVFMIPFLYYMIFMFDFQTEICWVAAILLVFNLTLYGLTSWKFYWQPRDFYCILDQERLRCDCPDGTTNTTFDILISQIREIHESQGEGSNSYHLITTDGERLHLTTNYGNPAWKFVHEIQLLAPDINVHTV